MSRLPVAALVLSLCGLGALPLGCKTPSQQPAPGSGAPTAGPQANQPGKVLTILATAEIRGTPEPCGCTSDPLGDVARVLTLRREAEAAGGAFLAREARGPSAGSGGALLVDAGGLRYGEQPLSPEQRPQADLKAQFLETTWASADVPTALGDEDLRFGVAGIPGGRRLASNVTGVPLAEPIIRDVAGVKVGVFGLLDPSLTVPAEVKVSAPVAAAQQVVAALQQRGAKVIIALAHMGRAETKRLVRAVPGITLAVAGHDTGEGSSIELVESTLVVQPAIEAQRVSRVEFHLGPSGEIATRLYGGAADREARTLRVKTRLAKLAEEIARLAQDPAAEPAYLDGRRQEKATLEAELAKLSTAEPPPPPPYATGALVAVTRRVARDPAVADAMKDLDRRAGEANRAAAEKIPVPPADKGEPRYIGIEYCGDCHAHEEAVTHWKTTVHAKAWQTLVDGSKQFSYDCIKCHVTGYGERGGSNLGHTEGLTAVQCEVCHGPGSLHAAKPKLVKMPVHSPTKDTCERCHTPEHSDTFQFEAYLRDVLGPGHGAKRREALGPGPTGHELRKAAVEKARMTK